VTLGAQHPHTLSSMSNFAVLLEEQGKLEQAGQEAFGVAFLDVLDGGVFCFTKARGLVLLDYR